LLEGEWLDSPPNIVPVEGPGPIDRIAEDDDEPGVGHKLLYASWRVRVEQIVRGTLANQQRPFTLSYCSIPHAPERKEGPVPPGSPVKGLVKKPGFLAQCPGHMRAMEQVGIQGRGSAFGGAQDQEVRQ
jgi:hypothetical protein